MFYIYFRCILFFCRLVINEITESYVEATTISRGHSCRSSSTCCIRSSQCDMFIPNRTKHHILKLLTHSCNNENDWRLDVERKKSPAMADYVRKENCLWCYRSGDVWLDALNEVGWATRYDVSFMYNRYSISSEKLFSRILAPFSLKEKAVGNVVVGVILRPGLYLSAV